MFDEKYQELEAKASEVIRAKGTKEEFIAASKPIFAIEAEPTDEQAQEIAQLIEQAWSGAFISVENELVSSRVKSVLGVIANCDVLVHAKTQPEMDASITGAVVTLIAELTESGMTVDEIIKTLDTAVAKVTRLSNEIKKSVNIEHGKIFSKFAGKSANDLTFKEMVALLQ